MSENATETAIDPELLDLLRCPVTRGPLKQEGDELVGEAGGLRYPIRDGLPVMLPEEAKLPEGFESLDAFEKKYGKQEEE